MSEQTGRDELTGGGVARGRIALVTGGGSGIGRATAIALAADGWSVVVAGRDRDKLAGTAALADADGAGALVVAPTDVTDERSVDALFELIRSRSGRLDLVFNNAGIARDASPDALDLATWHEVVATNLTGAFLIARGAFRMMRDQAPRGGRIINNGSLSAHAPRPNSLAYTTTKHGVSGLTRSLALDGRAHDIACGQIDIGNALTSMAAKMERGVRQADGSLAVEPTIDVAEVARTVLLMASMPPEANIQNVTVMATKMPFVGRG